MSVIIYGRRSYGRVDSHGGEYADTQFFHIDFLPLVPLASHWITNAPGGGERFGFPIKLHLRSVIATYLRIWAPFLALLAYVVWGAPGLPITAALVALSAWSWTWRNRRTQRARLRSDFDRVALGHRCDPARLTDDMREALATRLSAQYAQHDDPRPPDDVVRFGPRDTHEALAAYGILRVRGARNARATAGAEQMLAGLFETQPSDGGPYRETAAIAAPDLIAQIAASAQHHARLQERQSSSHRSWYHRPGMQLLGLALLTLLTIGGVEHITTPRSVDARTMHDARTGERITLQCDRMGAEGWALRVRDRVTAHIALCWLGDDLVAVKIPVDEGDLDIASSFTGKLERMPTLGSADVWVKPLHAEPEYRSHLYDDYLKVESPFDHRLYVALLVLGFLGGAVGWPLWLRARIRNFRARATT